MQTLAVARTGNAPQSVVLAKYGQRAVPFCGVNAARGTTDENSQPSGDCLDDGWVFALCARRRRFRCLLGTKV